MDNQSARDRADALLAAWNRRDYAEVASHLTPDVVLVDHTRHRTSTGPDADMSIASGACSTPSRTCGVRPSRCSWRETSSYRRPPGGAGTQSRSTLPGYDNVAPTNELMTMHLVTYMEFDDGGQVKGVRTYGDPGEVPLSAHPVGVG